MSAYNKQTWDTTSYVNPTRMNNMENGIANAACSESIAPVVTNPTTVAISSGSHFMLDGIRYRATTTISAGGTITPNTNCVAESVEDSYEKKTASTMTNSTLTISLTRIGNIVIGDINTGTVTCSAGEVIANFPDGFKPLSKYDFIDTYSRKRFQVNELNGAYSLISIEALSNTIIRGSFVYFTKDKPV